MTLDRQALRKVYQRLEATLQSGFLSSGERKTALTDLRTLGDAVGLVLDEQEAKQAQLPKTEAQPQQVALLEVPRVGKRGGY